MQTLSRRFPKVSRNFVFLRHRFPTIILKAFFFLFQVILGLVNNKEEADVEFYTTSVYWALHIDGKGNSDNFRRGTNRKFHHLHVISSVVPIDNCITDFCLDHLENV